MAKASLSTCSMRITQRRVQENISKATSANVHRLVGNISEDDSVGIDASIGRLLPDHGLTIWREAQQPQHALWYSFQHVAPARSETGMSYLQVNQCDALSMLTAGERI